MPRHLPFLLTLLLVLGSLPGTACSAVDPACCEAAPAATSCHEDDARALLSCCSHGAEVRELEARCRLEESAALEPDLRGVGFAPPAGVQGRTVSAFPSSDSPDAPLAQSPRTARGSIVALYRRDCAYLI